MLILHDIIKLMFQGNFLISILVGPIKNDDFSKVNLYYSQQENKSGTAERITDLSRKKGNHKVFVMAS